MAPVQLATSTSRNDGETVVSVTGDVDLGCADALRRVLAEALEDTRRLTVDVAGVTFIDSSGLSALVDAHHRARDAGSVLVVRHPSRMLTRLLSITRLDTLLTVEDPGPVNLPMDDGR